MLNITYCILLNFSDPQSVMGVCQNLADKLTKYGGARGAKQEHAMSVIQTHIITIPPVEEEEERKEKTLWAPTIDSFNTATATKTEIARAKENKSFGLTLIVAFRTTRPVLDEFLNDDEEECLHQTIARNHISFMDIIPPKCYNLEDANMIYHGTEKWNKFIKKRINGDWDRDQNDRYQCCNRLWRNHGRDRGTTQVTIFWKANYESLHNSPPITYRTEQIFGQYSLYCRSVSSQKAAIAEIQKHVMKDFNDMLIPVLLETVFHGINCSWLLSSFLSVEKLKLPTKSYQTNSLYQQYKEKHDIMRLELHGMFVTVVRKKPPLHNQQRGGYSYRYQQQQHGGYDGQQHGGQQHG
jgi:hypothetical protein